MDFIVGYIDQKAKRNQSGSVQAVLDNLSKNLDVTPDTVLGFLLVTCKQLGLFKLEMEMLIEIDQDDSLKDLVRIYEESEKL